MRYSLETPFVRSAAEDAWGHSRPTPSALRRCATTPPSPPWPRERSRLQLTPDSVGGMRTTPLRRGAPPMTHSCSTSIAAPPCHSLPPPPLTTPTAQIEVSFCAWNLHNFKSWRNFAALFRQRPRRKAGCPDGGMVDTKDLKSFGQKCPCEFESRFEHIICKDWFTLNL